MKPETKEVPPCKASHEPMHLVTRMQGDGTSYDYCMHCGWVNIAAARADERKRVVEKIKQMALDYRNEYDLIKEIDKLAGLEEGKDAED